MEPVCRYVACWEDELTLERKLVWKLDASLLVFSVLGLICRYIDQTNLNTAFVSGMK